MFYLKCFNQLPCSPWQLEMADWVNAGATAPIAMLKEVFMLMTLVISFRGTHLPLRSFQKLEKNRDTGICDITKFTHCSASCVIGQLWLYSATVGIASDLFILLVFNNAVLQRHASSNKTKRTGFGWKIRTAKHLSIYLSISISPSLSPSPSPSLSLSLSEPACPCCTHPADWRILQPGRHR